MARRKNVKRIDPKYFLHETVFREGDEAEMIQAGEDALADMGEEEILAQVAQLPPEAQAEIEATVATTVEKASQLNERGTETDRQEFDRHRSERSVERGGQLGAPLAGAAIGATQGMLMGLAAPSVGMLAMGGMVAAAPLGVLLAYVAIKASRRLQDADPEQPQRRSSAHGGRARRPFGG